ncbi:MAG: ATP synthase F1 subunit gamma [Candidatus Nealsonbacteria bacterium RIFCSPHIGHO2_12_FULL_38_18]|nr:MAG: ATP synthase F1 subunit gamma [Candidatus Nealsonbacteria bacterium RIFCSPHIGHO2_12_FULL_38_18]
MESTQSIKRRLKSIKNIGQITKAMELVAATKMRKSQEAALSSRNYAYTALDLLARISGQEIKLPELLRQREVKRTAFVILTSDKGLAGSFNSSVIRLFEKYIKKENINIKDERYYFIAIGKKAIAYLQSKGIKITEKFIRAGDFTTPEQINPISDSISTGYLGKKWDEVLLFSTYFISALKQEVFARKIFPVELSSIKKIIEEIIPKTGKFSDLANKKFFLFDKIDEYLIEPSQELALKALAEHLIRMQFYHLILETNASEHGARRMAMKNASDNAEELSESLNLLYNKLRQTNITKEITEIVSGTELLNN